MLSISYLKKNLNEHKGCSCSDTWSATVFQKLMNANQTHAASTKHAKTLMGVTIAIVWRGTNQSTKRMERATEQAVNASLATNLLRHLSLHCVSIIIYIRIVLLLLLLLLLTYPQI